MTSKIIILASFFCSLYFASILNAYDDKTSHPLITEVAVKNSWLVTDLAQNLGNEFSKNYNTLINGKKVIDWIKDGATAEDKEACRRASHMHDPTKPWAESYMSDFPPAEAYCLLLLWGDRPYSNVTWATGYLSPAPGGQKQTA